jgi:hypothetical protein
MVPEPWSLNMSCESFLFVDRIYADVNIYYINTKKDLKYLKDLKENKKIVV